MPHSEIRQNGGIPTLFLDGVPATPLAYNFMPSEPGLTNNIPCKPQMESAVQLDAMRAAGISLYFIRIEIKDPADFEAFFDRLSRSVAILRAHVPNAVAIPWLILCPYEDFHRKYPNDLQTFDDGSVGNYETNLGGRLADAKTPRHTHASLAWRHETAGFLRRLVKKVRQTPALDDAIVGYFFFPLHHESCYFYDFPITERLDGYSPAMRLAMRNYLCEKYAGDVSALRRAWGDGTVTFENACVPDRAARERSTAGVFYDPAKSQAVMDYFEIRSHVWADTLEYFARACKEADSYRHVVGAFFGYLLHTNTLWDGQSYFRDLSHSPYLDFWASPFHYVNKNAGMSVTLRNLNRTLQAHGKLFFTELDTCISSSLESQCLRSGIFCKDVDTDANILKRDFMMSLTEGCAVWRPDWCSGREEYNPDTLLPVVTKFREIAAHSLTQPMRSVAQVAAITQQESFFALPWENGLSKSAVEYPRLHELTYLGAPIDHYELQDALSLPLPHKLFLFQNAYLLDAHTRERIRAMRAPDRILVFLYAQGFLSPEAPTASAKNMSELIGIHLEQVDTSHSAKIVLTEAARAYGLTPGTEIGECVKPILGGMDGDFDPSKPPKLPSPATYAPMFYVDDPDAVVLGVYRDSGKAAFAIKEVDGCRVLYLGSSILNTAVLRALCRAVGVHLYTDGDSVLYANESYLGVHTTKEESLTLRLPAPRALREVFTDTVYQKSDTLTLSVKKGESLLFTYIEE